MSLCFLEIFKYPMNPSDNSGKVMTKRIKAADGTVLILSYRKPEAATMRALIQTINLKGDRKPPLSLIARRSMQLYLARLEKARDTRPDLFASEVAILDSMVTPVPKPAPKGRLKVTQ